MASQLLDKISGKEALSIVNIHTENRSLAIVLDRRNACNGKLEKKVFIKLREIITERFLLRKPAKQRKK